MPRATDEANLRAMADLVRALEKNGHTYISDGSIYFKISTMPSYGQLAHLDAEGMKPGARVDADSYAKEDARDFVLWKATKPDEPSLGSRRSARPPRLASRVLGDGAAAARRIADRYSRRRHRSDLSRTTRTRSPRARARPASSFSRFWMHVEYLIVDEKKMSKSLGNTYTIPDVVEIRISSVGGSAAAALGPLPQAIEFHVGELTAHEESLRRLMDFLVRLDRVRQRRCARRDSRRA